MNFPPEIFVSTDKGPEYAVTNDQRRQRQAARRAGPAPARVGARAGRRRHADADVGAQAAGLTPRSAGRSFPRCMAARRAHGRTVGAGAVNPQVWAARGYVVALPNPRGSTGFGQQYVDEISGDWGGRCYEDLDGRPGPA